MNFTDMVIKIITAIPPGCVLTYGRIAALAGKPKNSRQISRILGTADPALNLPWHRVVGAGGKISIRSLAGYEEQRQKLEIEGIEFSNRDTINLERYLMQIDSLEDLETLKK